MSFFLCVLQFPDTKCFYNNKINDQIFFLEQYRHCQLQTRDKTLVALTLFAGQILMSQSASGCWQQVRKVHSDLAADYIYVSVAYTTMS